jgi:aminopeptidase N
LQVDSIKNQGLHLSYQHQDHVLTVSLKDPIDMGAADSLTIWYQGVPSQSGFGSFGQGTHSDGPAIWTLSEPYGARDWWPCKQSLNDKIDSIDIYVTTPIGISVASNGVLMDSLPLPNDKVRYYWKHRYPIPAYLIAIGVTNYQKFSDYVIMGNGDSLEILNYVYPDRFAQAQSSLQATVDIMDIFNELFTDYPFAKEKYGHAQFGWGGGMEHQTMSFMGGFSVDLQAHELAHQWFGDKVTCGSWQDIWLNEGFATYSVGLIYEATSVDQFWPAWKNILNNSITSQPGGSVFVNDTSQVGRIFDGRLSYSKGAFLLHMIRWTIGDEAFFTAIRNYINDPDLAFRYARTNDLKDAFETASNMDLTEFFDDWFYGEGYPSFFAQIFNPQSGDSLMIILDQTTSHPSIDFFEIPVPIQLNGTNGEDTIVVVDHSEHDQVTYFDIPFQVESAKIDPDIWLISKGNETEIQFAVPSEEINPGKPLLQLRSNVFQAEIEIWAESNVDSWTSFELVAADGRTVDVFEAFHFPFKKKIAPNLPIGTYFLKWKQGDQSGTWKLIKH